MAGLIKEKIDMIISHRSNNDPILIQTTITKLMLKGIYPHDYSLESEDDPIILDKLVIIMNEWGMK